MAARRRRLSRSERQELWKRWKQGQSMHEIARVLAIVPSSVFFTLRTRGGIAPPPRRRSRLALITLEREEISRGLVAAQSSRTIAARLGLCRGCRCTTLIG